MLARLLRRLAQPGRSLVQAFRQRLATATKPAAPPLLVGTLTVQVRSRSTLVAQNALRRQQLLVRQRGVKRPRCTSADRALLVLLASRVRGWRHALMIVQPETMLRWHRQGFRLLWRRKSRFAAAPQPKVAAETIALIRKMAAANRLWDTERLRGVLLKLGACVAKTTVQRHMWEPVHPCPGREVRPPGRPALPWPYCGVHPRGGVSRSACRGWTFRTLRVEVPDRGVEDGR
jgi:hypothetical protein